ncbi:MAG: hypothetical protein HRU49_03880 [Winogradskyella sp.]|uniref:hypothetical protein n=1 Tax=Winogradskyella sp. TaxID=1883156 RepID=UPI0025E10D1F|nr:hypothetical protein [Winogradskyella sp.]NRB82901.1 hypothetical protein [Winogradskyella sp.]
MRYVILMVLVFTLCATSSSSAQSRVMKNETFQATYEKLKATVQGNSFKFIGNFVYDSSQRKALDTALNTIFINGNELSGQTSTLEINDKSIVLNGQISDYKVDYNDEKQAISISFLCAQRNFYIDIKANGYTFLAIKSGDDTINQIGSVERL